MSAVAVAVCPDGIVVASDGVSYDYDTGNVGAYVSKVILMPEYNCFIASAGMGAFGAALRLEVNQSINCFDDFVNCFERAALVVHRVACLGLFGTVSGPLTEVSCVIGGWSDRNQACEAHRLVSYAKASVNQSNGKSIRLEPFKANRLPGPIWCSHLPDCVNDFNVVPPPPEMESAEILARLICACRADSGFVDEEGDEAGRHYNVGGFLPMTIVRRDCIQSWIAHRWSEDEIGKPIDPSKGELVPSWQMPEVA